METQCSSQISHPLLDRAHKYKVQHPDLRPPECHYDFEIGAWVITETGTLWARSLNRQGPKTKKCDIETGEDQKGE